MEKILSVQDLRISFSIGGTEFLAVDGLDFDLHRGRVLGIVGESGCGKTVTALSLLRLLDKPGRIAGGKALFYGGWPDAQSSSAGVDLFGLSEDNMRQVRGHRIAMIFQEPMTSLNPVFTIGDQIGEAIRLHQTVNRRQARELAIEMLQKVRIPDAHRRIDDYPHQLSGGMRQRAMIAMALSCRPDILIADEPTTALDVTIQAQILELLQQLIEEMRMSVLLITHDLGVVSELCDEVLVMYAGTAVEQAPARRMFQKPKHPYTLGLLASIPPLFAASGQTLYSIPGMVPNLTDMPPGCRFAERCERAVEACRLKLPFFKYVGEGQTLRCINY